MVTYQAILNYGRGRSRASIYVYGAIGAGLLTFACQELGAGRTAAAFVIGALSWTPVEYLLHRFAFHSRRKASPGRRVHLDHHAHANSPEHIGAPVVLSMPIYALLILLFRALTGDLAQGSALSAGLATAYVAYERLHFWLHHGTPRTRVGLYLRRYHLAHHFKDARRSFGVTSPFWDWVFGTLPMSLARSREHR